MKKLTQLIAIITLSLLFLSGCTKTYSCTTTIQYSVHRDVEVSYCEIVNDTLRCYDPVKPDPIYDNKVYRNFTYEGERRDVEGFDTYRIHEDGYYVDVTEQTICY